MEWRLPRTKSAVSASGDGTLKVWDLETGRLLHTLEGHSQCVNGVAASADGTRAVSVSEDDTIKVWDIETGAMMATFHCDATPVCCAFVNDSCIAAGDREGRLYKLLLI